jgi:hypothetical protein
MLKGTTLRMRIPIEVIFFSASGRMILPPGANDRYMFTDETLPGQYAYLDTETIFWQTSVLSYPCNGCALYSWQTQQDMYRL